MNLLLLKFNNYYNRTIKLYDDIEDYKDNSTNFYLHDKPVNFIPNNGITTEQIIDYKEDWKPDYLVCFEQEGYGAQTESVIKSRWFIVNSTRLRTGQYKLTLKRDTIADNFNNVITAPCFIEKATVPDTNDVAIYNSEGLQLNQIKKSEELLKDKTGTGWIIGYLAPDTKGPDEHPSYIEINAPATELSYIYENSRNNWEYHQYEDVVGNYWNYILDMPLFRINVSLDKSAQVTQDWYYINTTFSAGTLSWNIYRRTTAGGFGGEFTNTYPGQPGHDVSNDRIATKFGYYAFSQRYNVYSAWLNSQSTYKNIDPFNALKDRYIYFADEGKFYQISVQESNETIDYAPARGSSEEIAINNSFVGFDELGVGFAYYNQPQRLVNTSLAFSYKKQRLHLTEVTLASSKTKISQTAKRLSDAPYKMLALPYGSITVNKTGEASYTTLENKEALNVASTIATQLGSNLYDIQLLPYCPITDITGTNSINISTLRENIDFEYILNSNNDKVGILLYCGYSSFSFDINKTMSVADNVVDFKVENEAKLYRLMSPNGASNFDFKLTKTGSITKFNIDCTYKPFNPYIHVNPNWGRLYGEDFNDYRGLVCQGDFSVPIVNDQWIQYQINNKNYLNAFNRETDSLEIQYGYQRVGNIVSAITGVAGGAASGGLTGAFMGNPIIGAVAGGAASLAGGIADVAIAENLHKEQMANRQDQFNYSLQNIQARPQTLAKSSAFDFNNKIWPVVEEYDCTDKEKVILKDKMKYEGMTVMRIGKISEFLVSTEQYIRGNLIKIEAVDGDYEVANDIKQEIQLGLRMTK